MSVTKEKHDLLSAWLTQESEVVARLQQGPGPGVARPEQLAGKTGLELMQGMLSAEIPYAAIAKTLDFCLIEVSAGVAIFRARPALPT